jgi:hypothetical protein
MRCRKILVVLAFIAPGLAACATQQAMTVGDHAIVTSNPKYRMRFLSVRLRAEE